MFKVTLDSLSSNTINNQHMLYQQADSTHTVGFTENHYVRLRQRPLQYYLWDTIIINILCTSTSSDNQHG